MIKQPSDTVPDQELTAAEMRHLDQQLGIRLGDVELYKPDGWIMEPWYISRNTPRVNGKGKLKHLTKCSKSFTDNIGHVINKVPMQRPNARWPADYEQSKTLTG